MSFLPCSESKTAPKDDTPLAKNQTDKLTTPLKLTERFNNTSTISGLVDKQCFEKSELFCGKNCYQKFDIPCTQLAHGLKDHQIKRDANFVLASAGSHLATRKGPQTDRDLHI